MKLNYDCARSVLLTVEKSKTIDEELNLNPRTVETIFDSSRSMKITNFFIR